MKKEKSALRRVLSLFRFGLCIAAIAFLYFTVKWHDSVRLLEPNEQGQPTPSKIAYRLIEQRDAEVVIEHDGVRQTRPIADIYGEMHVFVRLRDAARTEVRLIEGEEPGNGEVQIQRNHGRETVPAGDVDLGTRDERYVPTVELGIPNVVRNVDGRLALWAIVIFGPVWFIQAYRLVLMISVQGVKLGYWNAIKLTFAGNFFNFALPGTTGGDLFKAYYITRYTHRKTEVVTTIFLDRAIGLLGMVIIAACAILLQWNPEKFSHLILPLVLVLAGLMVGAVLIFSKRIRHALGLPNLAARLPMGEQILRIGRATVAMRQHKTKVACCLGMTFVLQFVVMYSAAMMAWALGMVGSAVYFIAYVAIGFLIGAIPISPPQAIGVMEAFYVQFFTQGGLNTASQAVTLALGVRLIQLVWALPGVLVPLLGAHLPSKEELEHLNDDSGENGSSEPAEAVDSADPGATDAGRE